MEPMVLESLLIFAASLLIPAGLLILSLKRKPVWVPEGPLAPFWSKLNYFSFGLSALVSALVVIFYKDYAFTFKGLVALTVAPYAYIFLQTLFTDFKQRLADRRILNISIVFSAILGIIFLNHYNYPDLVNFVLFFIFTAILFFIPSIGESDTRALALTLSVAYPIIGLTGIKLALILFFPLLISYFIYLAIKNKNFKAAFAARVSIPMVPFIILPALLLVVSYPFMSF